MRYLSGKIPLAATKEILEEHRDYHKEACFRRSVAKVTRVCGITTRVLSMPASSPLSYRLTRFIRITFDAAYGKDRVIAHLYL